VRLFKPEVARKVYARQTAEARAKGISNCPDCVFAHDANAKRIYAFGEMEADHVTAWSKGGDTLEANCQMLCKHHNRVKGNC
jgi:5-methylcytosine-specific restriction endonuclease McrA